MVPFTLQREAPGAKMYSTKIVILQVWGPAASPFWCYKGTQAGQGQSYTNSGQGGGYGGIWQTGLQQLGIGPFGAKGHI